MGEVLCPFHAMAKLLKTLEEEFPEKGDEGAALLFPNRQGHHASKEAAVRGIREVMERLKEPLIRTDGNGKESQRFGEHVMRVAGAQFFARRGVELFLIQLYARWGSAAILKYVQEAPLGSQAQVAQRLAKIGKMKSLECIQDETCKKQKRGGGGGA